MKGINRLKILQDAIDRNLHPGQAAEMLGITPRHCRRLLKRYRQLGPLGMNNHSRGRVGNHLLPTSLIDQALCIIREHYRDFGPTLALENLEEVHGLVLGKETIRRLMIKAGNAPLSPSPGYPISVHDKTEQFLSIRRFETRAEWPDSNKELKRIDCRRIVLTNSLPAR